MKQITKYSILAILLISINLSHQAYAQITAAKIFNDHMVLQRNKTIPIWGSYKANHTLSLTIDKNRVTTTCDHDGSWYAELPSLPAGGPYQLQIASSTDTLTFEDVLIGDVWVASGQSNMEWQVQQSFNAESEIKNADYKHIRFIQIEHNKQITPRADFEKGDWTVCDSNSVKSYSAVAYFFARKINKDINIPVGIIQSTWGGTPVEAWTSREMLLSSPITRNKVMANDSITNGHMEQDSLDLVKFWEIVYNVKNEADKHYTSLSFDDSKWEYVNMPTVYKDWGLAPYEGMVWLRKAIKLPADMQGSSLTINLGHPEMNYSLYFNGNEICKNIWNANKSHSYEIPAELVKETNQITVRMAVLWGGGGFNLPEENMYITNGNHKVSLAGKWKYKTGLEPTVPEIKNYHRYPSYLFNGMINPIIPYAISGFIWYQGEDNATAGNDYETLFPLMINDWRIRWKMGYLPFYFVQLANYKQRKEEPVQSDWAELREAQRLTTHLPNTGMACIIDIGEANNIHPKNKQEVGRRLALIAEKQTYNKDVVASGPTYHNFKISDATVELYFNTTSQLMTTDNAPVKGFAIAGKNHKFYWATAKIVDNKVILSTKQVKKPVAVRYGWADNPACNLTNSSRLPAVPFRTDDWQEVHTTE